MEYQVNFGFHAFSVPSAVVDNFIKAAKENHLKVLLYLLRYPDRQFSISQIASALPPNISEEEVREAFDFWMQFNILEEKTEGRQLELIPSAPPAPKPVPAVNVQDMPFSVPAPEPEPEPEEKIPNPLKKSHMGLMDFFSNADIQEMQNSSPELRKLIRIVQNQYYKGSFYVMQTKSLIWMYSYLGMPADVILILLKYCADVEKFNQQYINKLAYSWYEDDIMTKESAETKVRELTEFYTYQNYIRRLFEVNKISEKEKEFIQSWQNMGLSEELLKYAKEYTIEQTHDVNFKYIDKIFQSWKEKNITTLEEAKEERRKHAEEESKKHKGKKKKKAVNDIIREQETAEINKYLDLVN